VREGHQAWTDEEKELLRRTYPHMTPTECEFAFRKAGFHRKYNSITKAAERNGVRKTPETIQHINRKRQDILTHTPILDQLDWLPTFDQFKVVKADCAVVCSDLHIPYIDKDLFDKMCIVGKRMDATDCIIAGDLFDATMFSSFIRYMESGLETWEFQMEAASEILKKLLDNFENIWVTKGNHDNRIIKLLLGKIKLKHIFKWVTDEVGKRVKVSDYPFCYLFSGKAKIKITHAKSYSRMATQVANVMSAKEECSVMNAGGHLLGLSGSMSGRWVAGLGGLFDTKKFEYIHMTDTTHPKWNSGFFVIREGFPYMKSKHWTDWDQELR